MARSGKEKKIEPSVGSHGIHPAPSFLSVLKYERARADRANSQFSLVALDLHGHLEDRHEPQALIKALNDRIRTTDILGWMDERTLGILLPGTDAKGAQTFAVSFEKHYYVERLPAPFTVYSYPDHWLQNGSGSQSGGLKSEPEANSGFQRVSRKVEGTLSRSLPIWKRCLDIFGSLFLLALSSTLFFALAVYIKLVSPGPVFFRQKRVGYRATPFTFLKFRTMCANSDPRSHQVHLKELINTDQPMEKLDSGRDSRIIPGGRIVRKSCLDELPQLLNVLKGDMSLVGPRPCLTYEAEEYLRWHSHRFDVLPGITGLWQVSGKNKLTFKQMVRMDISYCRNMSLWLDLKILLLTLPTIIGFVFEGVVNRLGRTGLMPEIESTEESPKSDRVPNSIAEQI